MIYFTFNEFLQCINYFVEFFVKDPKLIISIFAFILSGILSGVSLYLGHLKSVDIKIEFGKLKFEKLKQINNRIYIPNRLKFQIDMFILNSGNRAGLVKNLKINFEPTGKFKEWYEKIESRINNGKSEKIEDHVIVVKSGEGIFRKIEIEVIIKNSELINPFSMSGIEDVGESEDLKELINEVEKYKKEKFKASINALKNREIGEFIIEGEITVPKHKICGITFTNQKLKREIAKIPEEFIKHLESILEEYQLKIKKEEILNLLKNELNKVLKQSREDIERYWEKEKQKKFGFSEERILRSVLDHDMWKIECLKKCRIYRKGIVDILRTLEKIYELHNKDSEFSDREIEELKSQIIKSEEIVKKTYRND